MTEISAGDWITWSASAIAGVSALIALLARRDSKKSADAAEKSANVAEKSLFALERPYLHILDVEKIERVETDNGIASNVAFSIANYGKIPAIITKVYYGIATDPSGTLLSNLAGDELSGLFVNKVVPSGEIRPQKIELAEGAATFFSGGMVTRGESSGKFFWIEIYYRGLFKEHRSFFSWEFNPYGLRLNQVNIAIS